MSSTLCHGRDNPNKTEARELVTSREQEILATVGFWLSRDISATSPEIQIEWNICTEQTHKVGDRMPHLEPSLWQ